MTRYLCCLAVLGVGVVPDWATAYHPCWAPPPPCGPVPAYPRQFYLFPPPAVVYEVPLPPPAVHAVPRAAAVAPPAPAPIPPTTRVDDAPPVRPAAAMTPPAPLPPVAAPTPAPKPADTIPPLVLPDPPAKVEPKAPALVLPPDSPVRPAVPTPAPPPDAIPPLVLPPDAPGGSTGVIPPTTARSSPLSAAARVQVFPVAGAAAAGAARRVGFFNHTDRDLKLTIEGRPVLLPAKSFLHAELPPTFRWSEAGGPPRRTTVPADSPGVDVLFGRGG